MMASSLIDVASKATFSRERGKTKQRKEEQRKKDEEERSVWIIFLLVLKEWLEFLWKKGVLKIIYHLQKNLKI